MVPTFRVPGWDTNISTPYRRARSYAVAAAIVCLAATDSPVFAASGASLYAGNCAACHQSNAAGVPGQYPPLKGRIDKIAASAAGKQYLANVLIHGMVGPIQAEGESYSGYMPPFPQLSDDKIAAILTWLSSSGGGKPAPVIDAADIAASRGRPLSSSDVAKQRGALANN